MLQNLHLGDTLAIDPHKLGYAPYPGAIFLLKNKNDVMYVNSSKEVRYLEVQTFHYIQSKEVEQERLLHLFIMVIKS